jgi:hypothetical protein
VFYGQSDVEMTMPTSDSGTSGFLVVLHLHGAVIAVGVLVASAIMASQALFGVPYFGHGIAMILVLPLVASMVWSPIAFLFMIQRSLRGKAIPRWELALLAINMGGLFLWWSSPS